MAKEYFSHDYYSRLDRKLKKLRKTYKMEGVGIYWCIVEMLYEHGGKISLSDIEMIADELKSDIKIVESVVKDFELFKIKSEKFYSQSGLNRLKERKEKSVSATKSAHERWKKYYANAERTHSEGNAIKESKVKESKVNEIKGNQSEVLKDVFLSKKENILKNKSIFATLQHRIGISETDYSFAVDDFFIYKSSGTEFLKYHNDQDIIDNLLNYVPISIRKKNANISGNTPRAKVLTTGTRSFGKL